MSVTDTKAKALHEFYLRLGDSGKTMFDVWEDGGARGDAVTPSTYSNSYRSWMEDLLRKFLDESPQATLVSIGCGNAAVESSLVRSGYRVLAVDLLDRAVELARSKGVDAVCADVMTWDPPASPWTVIYADGLLGHLYNPDNDGLQPLLKRFRSWLADGAGALIVSNDGPRTSADVQAHLEVDGFYWFSAQYLVRQVESAGFRDIWSTLFTYQRPTSGSRERVILTARA